MCIICDGATEQELVEQTHRKVTEHGYTMVGVQPGRGSPGWIYTIGLLEHHGHPELMAVTCDVGRGARIVEAAAACVVTGRRLEVGASHVLPGGLVETRPVCAAQLTHGAMAEWDQYYRGRERHDLTCRAIQLISNDLFCDRHARLDMDLSEAKRLLHPHVGASEPSGRGLRPNDRTRRRKASAQRRQHQQHVRRKRR